MFFVRNRTCEAAVELSAGYAAAVYAECLLLIALKLFLLPNISSLERDCRTFVIFMPTPATQRRKVEIDQIRIIFDEILNFLTETFDEIQDESQQQHDAGD